MKPLAIFRTDYALTKGQTKRLKKHAKKIMGDDYKVVILAHGTELSIVNPD